MEMESIKRNMRLDFDRQEDTNIMELTLKHGPLQVFQQVQISISYEVIKTSRG